MITNIWFYSLLPACASLYSVLLLRKMWRSNCSGSYIKLFANLAIMNAFQAVGYLMFSVNPLVSEYIADAYLISVYFLFAHLLMLAISLSEKKRQWLYVRLIYIFPFVLMLLHFFGLLVDSYRIEKNSLMHNDGDFAWCVDLFIIVASFFTALAFYYNGKTIQKNQALALKNLIALISFIPLVIAFSVLVILSMTRYAVPVAIIVPLISIYIAVVFYYISKSQIIDLLASVGPRFFLKRLKLAMMVLQQLKTKSDLKRFYSQLEKQKIQELMVRHNNEIQAAANEMHWHHTTLRKKLEDYNLV